MSPVRIRQNASFQRPRKKREPYDVVLIVCEGAKTEPAYFTALKNELRLSSANSHICGKECGSAPLSVVDHALQLSRNNADYDRIFCVFDKDRHETYQAAIDKVRKRRTKIEAITSIPCFEFWLLLHFEDSAHYYVAAGGNSACDMVIRDFKKHISEYEKGVTAIFDKTYPSVDTAIRRAELLEQRQSESGADNPSTKVHRIVRYLRELKNVR